NAIKLVTPDGEHRQHGRPEKIVARHSSYFCVHGQEVDCEAAEDKNAGCEKERHARSPDGGELHRNIEGASISRACRLADKSFGRKRKAIKEEGAYRHELQQDRIDGESDRARLCALRREPGEGEEQHHGADHDVAINGDGAGETRCIKQASARPDTWIKFQRAGRKGEAKQGGSDFSYERAKRNARNAPAKAKSEPDVEEEIHKVEKDLQHQRNLCAAKPDEPSGDCIIRKCRRRAPYTNVEIEPRQFFDFISGIKQ